MTRVGVIRVILLPCVLCLAVGVLTPRQASAQWISINYLMCRQVSSNFGDTSVVCTGWSKTEYKDNIAFYASAVCDARCESIGISTRLNLVIGVTAACKNPVSYTFWGGVQGPTQANPPYVYVRAGGKQRHFSRYWPEPPAPDVRPIGGDAVRTL